MTDSHAALEPVSLEPLSLELPGSPRPRSRREPRGGGAVALSFLAAALIPVGSAQAQATPPRALVSTTSDVTSLGFQDGNLLAIGGGGAPEPWMLDGHWLGTTGLRPTDVDGVAFRPGFRAGSADSIAFSLLSDQKGVRDGDVLIVGPAGGFAVLVGEDELAGALGLPGAALDVDAFDFDAQGALLFSLQADLAGTSVGPVADGDVLRLLPGGGVEVVFTEADVQGWFEEATGSTAAVLDVQGFDLVAGEPWFLLQAPSSHDGGVLVGGANPRFEIDENVAGLGGAELDALAWLEPTAELPRIVVTPDTLPATQNSLHLEITGNPGGMALLLVGGTTAFLPYPRVPGFGAILIDPNDPFFQFMLTIAFPVVPLDGTGRFEADVSLFPQAVANLGFCGEFGWSFQVVDFPSVRISAPFRVEEL